MTNESQPHRSLEEKIITALKQKDLSKRELAQYLGHTQISGQLKKILHTLLQKKSIAYTIPEKPGSREQKYRLLP